MTKEQIEIRIDTLCGYVKSNITSIKHSTCDNDIAIAQRNIVADTQAMIDLKKQLVKTKVRFASDS